ncbi:tripartite tricarboxylate transporter substrate binding protein [Acuticoccus kandeliae]|uniref:tripartite tricarboxylate transporter substrate binding protein n=1 Tax=Acuticoccus kandeliae TaxID=2073160 RepID=UPI0013008ECE|nr:tripartite tricarboxylate transporter substrate binding protein [Acuticoccus kandeliae]
MTNWRSLRGLRSTVVAAATATAIGLVGAAPAMAEWQPTRDVEILVTTGAGSGPDQLARLIQGIWKKYDIVPVDVAVVNKPGGGGAVGWAYFNRQFEGDGHAIAVGGASMISNNLTGRSDIGWHDLTPLAHLISEYIVVTVNPDSDFKTAQDLLDALKADPGAVSIGVATSKGNSNHQGIALPAKEAGVRPRDLNTVIFQSGGEARTAVMGGHIDAVPTSVGSMVKQMEGGKLRALAVASPRRLKGPMADVPTWTELGFPISVSNWRGIIGPKGMTDEQIAYWEDVMRKTVETEEWQQSLDAAYQDGEFLGHKEFADYMAKEEEAIRGLLDELGLLATN